MIDPNELPIPEFVTRIGADLDDEALDVVIELTTFNRDDALASGDVEKAEGWNQALLALLEHRIVRRDFSDALSSATWPELP